MTTVLGARPRRLWPFLFAALVVVVSDIAHAEEEVFCGLGPPPGSPEFAAYRQRQDRQRAALGYQVVCERKLTRFDYAAQVRPMAEVSRRLAFNPVPLDSTPFATYTLLGGIPDHGGDHGSTALHRTFRTPDGRMVDLFEWDMSVDHGDVYSRKDLQTERVNDFPAQLIAMQTPSGKAASILMWVANRRSYELTVNENIGTKTSRPSIAELAASIPVVPAAPEPDRCRVQVPGISEPFDGCFGAPPPVN
jgi:hypothetical protein